MWESTGGGVGEKQRPKPTDSVVYYDTEFKLYPDISDFLTYLDKAT